MEYYYLVASQPWLTLGDKPPVSLEEYLFSAAPVLSPEDYEELRRVLEGRLDECRSDFARRWRDMDAQLRNAVAAVRAQRNGVEARRYHHAHGGFEVWIEKAVADAYAKADPLERELALDRCRWRIVEQLAAADPFGLAGVLAFAVKLVLAHRWAAMEEEAGRTALAEAVESVRTAAGQGAPRQNGS